LFSWDNTEFEVPGQIRSQYLTLGKMNFSTQHLNQHPNQYPNNQHQIDNQEGGHDMATLQAQFGNFQVSGEQERYGLDSAPIPQSARHKNQNFTPPAINMDSFDEPKDWDEPITPHQADLNAKYRAAGPITKRGQHATYSPGPPIQTSKYLQGPDGALATHCPFLLSVVFLFLTLFPSGCNLFVFHIPNKMTTLDLFKQFERYGNILSARIMVDKQTGRNRGFGFVSFDNQNSAVGAIKGMNGFKVRGRTKTLPAWCNSWAL
jgi:hypothetical protein